MQCSESFACTTRAGSRHRASCFITWLADLRILPGKWHVAANSLQITVKPNRRGDPSRKRPGAPRTASLQHCLEQVVSLSPIASVSSTLVL